MKKFTYPILAAAVLFFSAFTAYHSVQWEISPDHSVSFESEDPSGIFKEMTGTIEFVPAHIEAAKFDVTIPVNSINTGNGMQNKHAISAKWFDAVQFPDIRFSSTKVERSGAGYQMNGSLTIHGVSKKISFPFTFNNNVFAAQFDVNRNDFNIGEPGGKASEVMKMNISVPVTTK